MSQDRGRDLVLAPNEYAYILDETKGNIAVYVGPFKTSLAQTDQPVFFNEENKRFEKCALDQAVRLFVTAPEGWYVSLKNPTRESDVNFSEGQPKAGATPALPKLEVGRKVNIPGPVNFSLWPGQIAKVVPGHTLRSNQYVIVRIYEESSARNVWNQVLAAVSPADEQGTAHGVPFTLDQISLGKLLIVKGTQVNFFMPPTGFEVVPEPNGNYIREAVTLERLEYCVLLDENGNKRYVRGPDVVFPAPTEQFLLQGTARKFRAYELNEQMGLYVKVIADYTENDKSYKTGEELFLTGKDTKIYYPRSEHAIIQDESGQQIHHAIAIPDGEARYVLDKDTGKVELTRGPKMFLPDPRKHVVVRRLLELPLVSLLYPGNEEALAYNASLQDWLQSDSVDMLPQMLKQAEISDRTISSGTLPITEEKTRGGVIPQSYSVTPQNAPNQIYVAAAAATGMHSGAAAYGTQTLSGQPFSGAGVQARSLNTNPHGLNVGEMSRNYDYRFSSKKPLTQFFNDKFGRKENYSRPKTITLDAKYDGAVTINIWSGYAVQLVAKSGKKRIVKGPQTVLLEYDETPEIMVLSTGKPKSTDNLLKTAYLKVDHNRVTDIVTVETKDLVSVAFKLAYEVNFEGDPERWFNVQNYVKFLTDFMRSLLRNLAKNYHIEALIDNPVQIIRTMALNLSDENKTGRFFEQNNMRVCDVEVLDVQIQNKEISDLLLKEKHGEIKRNLTLAHDIKETEQIRTLEQNRLARMEALHEVETKKIRMEQEKAANEATKIMADFLNSEELERAQLTATLETQEKLGAIKTAELARQSAAERQRLGILRSEADIRISEQNASTKNWCDKMTALAPQLGAALQSFADKDTLARVSESMAPLAIMGGKSVAEVVNNLLRGTYLENVLEKKDSTSLTTKS